VPLFAGTALALLGATGALFAFHPKGAYLAYCLDAAVFAAGAVLMLAGAAASARAAQGHALAAGAFPAMLVASALVAYHWGGSAALGDIALPAVLALAVVGVNRLRAAPLWDLGRPALTLTFFATIVFAILIPISGSYYAGSRFSTVGSDIGVRLRHWGEALEMVDPGLQPALLGMGLGRYPSTYFWKNSHGETPGSHRYEEDKSGNAWLRLGAPQYAQGYGEILRVLQQVDMEPGRQYRMAMDVRRQQGNAKLGAAVCDRWLIFPEHCYGKVFDLAPADGEWHHYSTTFPSERKGAGWLPAPTRIELGADGVNVSLDVDNVSLTDESGRELIRNGSFSFGHNYWFFSSDRNHFPWHVKNFAVYLIFEMGALGALAVGLFVLYALGSLAARALHGELYAGVGVAAMAGFLVVGMFDSLFDVPRLTLVFFLVAAAGCMLPPKKKRVKTRRRKEETDPAPA
jgi:hypothetical protein